MDDGRSPLEVACIQGECEQMPESIRVSIIGAGSAQFSLTLVKDLCLTPSLAGSQVVFVDVNEERLGVVHKLATRYANEVGADLRFESCADWRTTLCGSDFVINTAYVKGHPHEWAMRDIAAEHGYYYDGVHLGDFYQLQLALDVAREMQQACPDAWLIQSANPVFNCCTLVARDTETKVCGLCHGHLGYRAIARTVGIDPQRVVWQAPGFNHDIWLTHFIYEGEDAYPLIDEWVSSRAEEYWRSHVATHTHDIHMSRAAVHQYHMYGLFPVGDTVRRVGAGSTVGCTAREGEWWYHTDLESKKYWFGEPWGGPDSETGRRFFERRLESRIAEMAEAANDEKVRLTDLLGSAKTGEQMVSVIDALVNDTAGQFQVNVPNHGAIEGVPGDVVVEVPAVVSRKGIQPIHVGSLPAKVMLECLLPHWLDMERNLLAFRTGDLSVLLWNALGSHQTRSYEQGMAVLQDLLSMKGHEEMNQHFGFPPGWRPGGRSSTRANPTRVKKRD